MTTVIEIEKAVANLPKREFDKFRSWFEKFDAELWDKQFEADVIAGKIAHLEEQALKDFKEGRCTKL